MFIMLYLWYKVFKKSEKIYEKFIEKFLIY